MNSPKSTKPRVFRIIVSAIIVRNSTVLLLQRPENEKAYPGMWELPGGKKEFGETHTDALVRKVLQETELTVSLVKPISVFDYVLEKYSEFVDTTQINFLATLKDPKQEPVVGLEHQVAKWFTLEEIKTLDRITDETRRSIVKVL